MEGPSITQQPAVPFSDMRDRVTIQRRAGTQGTAGQPEVVWSDVATVWAKVEPLEATEVQQAGRVVTVASGRVTIRYHAGLSTKDRLVLGGRVLNIGAVVDVGNRRRQQQISYKEEA